jgi:hypothetical protein
LYIFSVSQNKQKKTRATKNLINIHGALFNTACRRIFSDKSDVILRNPRQQRRASGLKKFSKNSFSNLLAD